MLGTDVTPEMVLSSDLKQVVSKKGYAASSKNEMAKTHLGVGTCDTSISKPQYFNSKVIQFNILIL